MSDQNTYGTQPGARSPEYDDGLTVQDTTTSARPRTETGAPGASSFGNTATGTSVPPIDGAQNADETGTLISADKVVGTAVYDAAGERLGTIDSIMLNKRSGKVAYAVMSFGGFLGIGERYHPLPWDALTYDHDKGGYNVQHSADDLRKAPNYSRDEVSDFDYGTRSNEVDDYYGVDIARGASAERGAADPQVDDRRTVTSTGAPVAAGLDGTDLSDPLTSRATGIEAADAIGSTTGAGSSGMGSTGMGANRNF